MTLFEMQTEISSLKNEIKLIEAWRNAGNTKGCNRMILELKKEIERLQEHIHLGEYEDEYIVNRGIKNV